MAITAKDIQNLRNIAGVGMMEAKKALEKCDGNTDEAMKYLRENGLAKMAERTDRENAQGSVAVGRSGNVAAIVLVKCETDFVAKSPEFKALVQGIADSVAAKGEAAVSDHQALLEQLIISLKENIEVGKIVRFEAAAGSVLDTYLHVQSERGVNATMVEIANSNEEAAHEVVLHIAFARPKYLNMADVPADVITAERETQEQITRNEGKPEAAIAKIVEGRMGGFFKSICLNEQEWAKDNKQTIKQMVGPGSITRFAQLEIG
jgi:elongation factor Ts